MSVEILNRLGEPGAVTEELTALQNREFSGEAAFRDALRERSARLSPAYERQLLAHSEIGDFLVAGQQIERIEAGRLSPRQIEAIDALAGARFRYRWAFAEALAAHTNEWAYLAESPLNKRHNRKLRRQLEYMFRHFDRQHDSKRTDGGR